MNIKNIFYFNNYAIIASYNYAAWYSYNNSKILRQEVSVVLQATCVYYRGGRGKLFIGASCATPNCSLVNICTVNVIPPPEKSEPEISICHVCPPVKVM